jgi:hypothetical protein
MPLRSIVAVLARAAAAALFGLTLAAPRARAQGIDIENFKPALDPYGYMTVNGAHSLEPAHFHVQAVGNWAKNPIEFHPPPTGRSSEIVNDLAALDLGGAVGVLSFGKRGGIELGANVPLVLIEQGTRIDDPLADFDGFSIGSIRTDVKITFFDRDAPDSFPVGIALRPFAEWASAKQSDLLSNNGHNSFGGTLIVERRLFGRLRLGLEAGYQWIDGREQVAGFTYDDKLLLSGGAAFDIAESWALYAEAFHWARIGNPWKHEAESPLEGDIGIKRTGTLYLALGAGAGGLVHGVGAADWRVHVAIGLTF